MTNTLKNFNNIIDLISWRIKMGKLLFWLVLNTFLVYLGFVFVLWDWNVQEWKIITRFLFAVVEIFVLCFTVIFKYPK